MNPKRAAGILLLTVLAASGCGFFTDPQPDNLFLQISGPAGAEVELHLTTDFVAGVDELGVTRVQVFSADTVIMKLPVDTVFNISVPRRFFLQAQPADGSPLDVGIRIDVDERNLFDRSGQLLLDDPFRYVYLFNQITTLEVELI